MQRNEFLRLTAAAGACLTLGGCKTANASSASQDVQYFRYADNQPDTYPTTQAAYRFSELVNERTGGRIQIEVYANAELGDETSVIEQVQLGMIDFARVSLGALSKFDTKLNVLQMPYLYADSSQMWRVLNGPIGDDFKNDLPQYNLYCLSWFDAGARSFYTSVGPIAALEDIQGLTIRVQESDLMTDMVRALGANPVELVYNDVYSGLQSGEIDGAENNFPSYEGMSHYEVAKYFSEDEHMRVPEMQVASKTTMDRFSASDQEILRRAAEESAEYERELWIEREAESREKVEAAGTQINTLAPKQLLRFRDAVAPLYVQYCADYTDIIAAIRAT